MTDISSHCYPENVFTDDNCKQKLTKHTRHAFLKNECT